MKTCTCSRLPAAGLLVGTSLQLIACILAADASGPGQRYDVELRSKMLSAEEARAPNDHSLGILFEGLVASTTSIRATAARSLGRLERQGLVEMLRPPLADTDVSVRQAAAWALAQSVNSAEDGGPAAEILLSRFGEEPSPLVRGDIGAALGRIRVLKPRSVSLQQMVELLVELAADKNARLGATRGIDALARRTARSWTPDWESIKRLRSLLLEDTFEDCREVRSRRLLLSALNSWGKVDVITVETLLTNPDGETRRLAVAGLAQASVEAAPLLVEVVRKDASPRARYEALRSLSSIRAIATCQAAWLALQDQSPHVMLLAIEVLGGCPAGHEALVQIAKTLPTTGGTQAWHRATRALEALSQVVPTRAAPLLAGFVEHPDWVVRAHAADVSSTLKAIGPLEHLSSDPHPNVRARALLGLASHQGHGADDLFLDALENGDYQLLITASTALEGSTSPAAVPSLLKALARITSDRRQTSRSARSALLARVGELGDVLTSTELMTYLNDFDPVIADQASSILNHWSGRQVEVEPEPLPATPVPTLEELDRLRHTQVVLEMRRGGSIVMRLLPFEAPTNASRFARLAASGYFDGLAFHRVEPNFVIQGGSPNANEYAGDGPYTRDEVSPRSHLRSTVGLSTRGRDTGDAQLFINLVDNVRLDHNYTIFAIVVNGMDVADAVLEADIIERAYLVEQD